jgi:recombination protein RecT
MAQSTARPQLVDTRQGEQQKQTIQQQRSGTLRAIFENPKVTSKLAAAVPGHLNPQRMLRVLSLCVQRTPKLAEAHPMTLLGAMMVCASLGLEPNMPLQHAFLIPYNHRRKKTVEINVIIGYRGFIDLARRTGTLVSLHADVVYGAAELGKPGDLFEFEYGSDMHLKHVPTGERTGPKIWAYAHSNLKDGQAFEVLPYGRVLQIRDTHSEAYRNALRDRAENPRAFDTTPWVMHEHQMSSKTMVRQLSRMLPMSIEFANAVALDAMSESGRLDLASLAEGGFDIGAENIIDGNVLDDVADDDAASDGQQQQQQTSPASENTAADQQKSAGTSADRSRDPGAGDPPSAGSSESAPSRRRASGPVNFDV